MIYRCRTSTLSKKQHWANVELTKYHLVAYLSIASCVLTGVGSLLLPCRVGAAVEASTPSVSVTWVVCSVMVLSRAASGSSPPLKSLFAALLWLDFPWIFNLSIGRGVVDCCGLEVNCFLFHLLWIRLLQSTEIREKLNSLSRSKEKCC